MNLTALGVSYQWNHTAFVLLGLLISLGMMFSRFSSVVACVRISFIFKAESYSTVWIDHISFIHSSVDGHLGPLYLSAIGNDAAMNLSVQTSL